MSLTTPPEEAFHRTLDGLAAKAIPSDHCRAERSPPVKARIVTGTTDRYPSISGTPSACVPRNVCAPPAPRPTGSYAGPIVCDRHGTREGGQLRIGGAMGEHFLDDLAEVLDHATVSR